MATTELKPIVLTGIQTREVVKMSGTFFYKEGTKMADDFKSGYHRYRYNGVVFTVPVDNDFHADFKEGMVQQIKIQQVPDEDNKEIIRYQFDNHINDYVFKKFAKFDAEIEAIKAGSGVTTIPSVEEAESMA